MVWFIAPVTAAVIQFQEGAGIAALPIFMAGFIPLLVLLASYRNKQAYWKLGVIDYICLAFSLLALGFWIVFDQGFVATLCAILADGIAFIPTYIKSWKAPDTETLSSYYSGSFNALLSLATVPTFSFITIGFAAYLFIGNLIEVVLVLVRRRMLLTKGN